MNKEFATRWRALHDEFKDYFKEFKKLLVNRQAWQFLTALFRAFVWFIRLLGVFM